MAETTQRAERGRTEAAATRRAQAGLAERRLAATGRPRMTYSGQGSGVPPKLANHDRSNVTFL